MRLPPNARGARLIQVIEVVTKEGEGRTEDDDLVREVTRYYSTDGDLLAVRDPYRVEPGIQWNRPRRGEVEFTPHHFDPWEVDAALCCVCGRRDEEGEGHLL